MHSSQSITQTLHKLTTQVQRLTSQFASLQTPHFLNHRFSAPPTVVAPPYPSKLSPLPQQNIRPQKFSVLTARNNTPNNSIIDGLCYYQGCELDRFLIELEFKRHWQVRVQRFLFFKFEFGKDDRVHSPVQNIP